jgi:tetratricopeptide (TPR) repeat protein
MSEPEQQAPSDTVALLTEAKSLQERGDAEAAQRLCDQVLMQDPKNIDALRIHAIIAIENEQFLVAEGFLKRITRLAPQHIGALLDLARLLGERGRFPESLDTLQLAMSISPESPDVQLLLGNMLGIVGRHKEAREAYQKCLEHRPDDPGALIGLGHMQRIEGRQDKARESYTRCTEIRPDIGTTWWYLASLHGYVAGDADVQKMRQQLATDSLEQDAVIGLHFALACAFEKRKQYEDACEHYVLGNSTKRATVDYDPVKIELDQRKIRDTYTGELLNSVKAGTDRGVTPIFIVGIPRSGSTLIEQILASHSQVEGCGELPYILTLTKRIETERPGSIHYTEAVAELDDDRLNELGDSYLLSASTHRKEAAPFFTDKMPANFPHIGLIRQILPHAKIIDARREPMATCVANYRQLFAQQKSQSYDLLELGEYYLQYLETMQHWDKVLPGQVLHVQYEHVVADVEAEVRRILEFCGLPFEQACLDFHESKRPVNTASSEQVRQPIYSSAVEFWKNYDPYLDELRDILEPVLS